MKVNTKYKNRFSKNTITEYFNYKKSPYSESKIHKVAVEKLGG
jgi:hypothetical protein